MNVCPVCSRPSMKSLAFSPINDETVWTGVPLVRLSCGHVVRQELSSAVPVETP